MADVNIDVLVDVLGITEIKNLSVGLRNLIGQVNGVSASTRALDARQKALNIALGNGTSTGKQHAKTISDLARNQSALSGEVKKVTRDLKLLEATQKAGLITAKNYKKAAEPLREYGKALGNIKTRAFNSDLQNIGLEMRRLGKDAQFTGRNLIIGLTTPILMFARTALYSLLSVDRETVRLTKLLEGTAMTMEQAYIKLDTSQAQVEQQLKSTSAAQVAAAEEIQRKVDGMLQSYQKLNDEITSQALKFGVAKELVTAITGDFAELGFAANESVTRLAELTLQMEKLGGLDITSSQQFVQSVYQQTARIVDASGRQFETTAAREEAIISSVTAQLAMFNTVENVTAVSLRDLAEAFPEMAAAATSFGLSMTEATALLAPMKAAGFEIGASANSIKVSLQRLVAPTKQNLELINRLADSYAKDLGVDAIKHFKEVSGAGIDSLQSLIDMFIALDDQGKNTEATLEFFAQVFGVRQGPRMERSIAELALFQNRMQGITGTASNMEVKVREVFNTAYTESQKANGGSVRLINTIEDIGVAARIATAQVGQTVEGFGKVTQQDINNAKNARKALADFIKEKSMEGEDVFAGITTQAGKALVVQMAGASSALDIADKELKQSLGSLAVQFDRLKVAFKVTASSLINEFRPAIEKIIDSAIKFMEKLRNLDPALKKTIAGIMAFVAAIGPLVFIFGQFRLAGGVVLQALGAILPGVNKLTVEAIAAAPALMRLNKPLVMIGNTITTDAGKFSILIAKIASMDTPLGRTVNKLGQLVGLLKQGSKVKPFTAQQAIIDDVNKISGGRGGGAGAVTAIPNFLGTKKFDRSVQNQLQTNFRKQFGMTMNQYQKIIQTVAIDASTGKYLKQSTTRGPGGQFTKLTAAQRRAIAVASSADNFDDVINALRQDALDQVTKNYQTQIKNATSKPVTKPRTLAQFGTSVKEGAGKALTRTKEIATQATTKIKDTGSKTLSFFQQIPFYLALIGKHLRHPIKALGLLRTAIMGSAAAFVTVKAVLISAGIGLVLLAIAAVVIVIKNNFEEFKKAVAPAIKTFKTAFSILKEGVMSLIQPFLNFIATFINGGDQGSQAVHKISAVITVLANAFRISSEIIAWLMRNVVAKAIMFLLGPIVAVIKGIINIISGVIDLFKGNFSDGIKKIFIGLAQGALGLLGPFAYVIRFIVLGFLQIAKAVNFVGGLIGKLIPGVGKGTQKIVDALEATLGFIDDAMALGDGKELLNSAQDMSPDAKEAGEVIGDSVGEGIEEGIEQSSGSVGQALKDMMQQFVDKTLDYVSQGIQKYVGELTKALQDQKEAALKVFDDQLKTIDILEKAEESLTKTKEYELDRRKMLDERELNRQNYVRNRALAIYEGRVDDARMLDLEEQKSKIDSAKDIADLDQKRYDDLAKENRDAIRDAIKEAKDQASEYYDSVIEDFQKAAEKITEFPPNTFEEFNAQLNQLLNSAKQVAGDSNVEFSNMMNDLAVKITTGLPNEAVGAFSLSLDKLVEEAMKKYGLNEGIKDNSSVIGATIGMLNAIPAQINEGQWSNQARAAFGKNLELMPNELANIGNRLLGGSKEPGSLKNILFRLKDVLKNNNPFLVWVDAIKRANKSIQNALERTIDSVISKTKNLAAALSPLLAGIAGSLDSASGGGGSGGGGGGTGGGTGGTSGTSPSGETMSPTDILINKALGYMSAVSEISRGIFSVYQGKYAAKWMESDGMHMAETGNDAQKFMAWAMNAVQAAYRIPRDSAAQKLGFAKGAKIGAGQQYKWTHLGETFTSLRYGGMVPKPPSQSVPAMLHGGEYVVNANAVRNIGVATLQNLNSMRNMSMNTNTGSKASGVESYSEQNISICVDNFIGEREWFESMMKEYNIKVVPNNQRAAGTNKTVVRTYNGINRGF